ncbi:porin [Alkalilimnicola ehrlichii]|uniref:Porin domain-containing protein n=1 Tax=Alkalilimnicola ehrlichii TaxID=351052 RepID=A0A3E0WVM6_9GAMM|nr:porin [Alkalilimnicola ehrlichii]RFA36055.1 hypothetical protein CAL65_11395 [Alkalilimnicola ehrlichii]
MKKLFVVAGCCAGALWASAAAAEVEIYGQAHIAISHIDNGDDYSAVNVSSNASRIGFRAAREVGDGLRALVQIEGQVNFDNEANERFTSRDSFAGLEGHWGLLRVGRFDTPNKALRARTDFFGNQIGDSRNIVRGNYVKDQQGFDERLNNGIAYRTPSLNGFFGEVHYSPESGATGNAADGNDNDTISVALSYLAGPLYAAVAHERWNASRARLSGVSLGSRRIMTLAVCGWRRWPSRRATLTM